MVQPKGLISIDTVVQKGWIEGVNDIEDVFGVLPLTRSFAKALERDIDNDEAVHLAVTATASQVEEHSEGDDLANELPEIRRTLCLPCIVCGFIQCRYRLPKDRLDPRQITVRQCQVEGLR
jgi:hypothetical protein